MPVQSETCEGHYEPFEIVPLHEVYNAAKAEKEAWKEFMNEYQVMLYDFMYSLPLPDDFKDELHKVVLASKVSNIQEFLMFKNIIFKMANGIKEGALTITKTIRAIFVGTHKKALQRRDWHTSTIVHKTVNEHPVPFYNWLTE